MSSTLGFPLHVPESYTKMSSWIILVIIIILIIILVLVIIGWDMELKFFEKSSNSLR